MIFPKQPKVVFDDFEVKYHKRDRVKNHEKKTVYDKRYGINLMTDSTGKISYNATNIAW